MSWSVSAMGKGEAVGRKLAADFAQIASYNMPEPEQAMANKAAEICAAACGGAPDGGLIVRGEGHAYKQNDKMQGMHFKLEIDLLALAE